VAELLLVGSLGKPHGLDGSIYVQRFNPGSDIWAPGARFILVPGDRVGDRRADVVSGSEEPTLTLASAREAAKGRLCCRFTELRGREAAEGVRGGYLAIPLATLPPAGDDELYYHEVKGWAVVDAEGGRLGTVIDVVETYTTLLEVRPDKGGPTYFIPLVESIVTAIDRARRAVVVAPPEGLLP